MADEKKVPEGLLLNGQIPIQGAVLHLALTVQGREELRQFISQVVRPVALKLGFDVELRELPPTGEEPVPL